MLPSGAELPKSLTDHGNCESCWVQPVAFLMVGGRTPFPSQTMELAWHRRIWPSGPGIQTSCLRSGCPSSGMGRHPDYLSSSGIHDAAIRCRATKITDRSWELWILLSTAGSIFNGGRAYTIPIPNHGTGMASTYLALWSRNGDAKTGSFLLAKVAHRSITGVPHEENTGWRNHPFCWKGLAHMWESICLDVAWTWKVNWHKPDAIPVVNLRKGILRQVSLNDLVPPSLMMYDTTTTLSHIRHTTWDLCWGRDTATLSSTASIINRLTCWLFLLPGQWCCL